MKASESFLFPADPRRERLDLLVADGPFCFEHVNDMRDPKEMNPSQVANPGLESYQTGS